MTAQIIKIHRQKKQVRGFTETLNGIPLEMISIPAGTFTMGAPESEADSNSFERPQREVTVGKFYLGRYPITQAQWQAVVTAVQPIGKELNPNPSRFTGENLPVDSVIWYDAIEFCARLSQYSGKNYRLPSEAEWEYACRAGTTTPFHFGETISTVLANYNGSDENKGAYGRGERGEYRRTTIAVGSLKAANNFGLSDMHGNAWEWCLDPWHRDYRDAPKDGRVWDLEKNDNRYQSILDSINVLLEDGRSRVHRGGSWNDYPGLCRSAFRYLDSPDDGDYYFGLRVALSPPRI